MQKTQTKRLLSLLVCIVLVAATALFAAGCGKSPVPSGPLLYNEGCALGQGEKQFELTVADQEGKELVFEISTYAQTVGEALLELGLIEGEEGPYGLYIKSVNGIVADYDTTGTYWAFYVDGDYALSGVDATDIEDGTAYALRVEK
jgi:hypothetical protein